VTTRFISLRWIGQHACHESAYLRPGPEETKFSSGDAEGPSPRTLVVLSYREVVSVYTRTGGSYVVARENFGPRVAQVAPSRC
jgi:hypothetical protein